MVENPAHGDRLDHNRQSPSRPGVRRRRCRPAATAGGLTSIRGALDFSVASIEANGIEGTRRAIDLSADGRDWEGDGQIVAAARQRALDRGIVINGLAIRPDLEQTEVEGVKYDLNGYFHAFVGGPGSFTMVVENPVDFPQTVAKKLILEIAGLPDAERSAISN